MAENDWDGWKKMTDRLGQADTDRRRRPVRRRILDPLKQRHREGLANSILIKLNQIGTLTETLDAIEMASRGRLHHCVISHRSGETEDTLEADLAVAVNAGQIKTGSLCRGADRVCKYNQLSQDRGRTWALRRGFPACRRSTNGPLSEGKRGPAA